MSSRCVPFHHSISTYYGTSLDGHRPSVSCQRLSGDFHLTSIRFSEWKLAVAASLRNAASCLERTKEMLISRVFTLAFVTTVLFEAVVLPQERQIKRSDLPAAVDKTVAARSQGATVRGYSEERENGK